MTDVTHFRRVVGIDISKSFCDVHMTGKGGSWRQDRSVEGIKDLVAKMQTAAPDIILMEATGGYERAWADALAEAGLRVRVVNARQAHHFNKATGQSAKTDKLDAKMLALMAERLPPGRDYVIDHKRKRLAALVARRRQLIDMKTSESNRLDPCLCHDVVKDSLTSISEFIESQIDEIDALIDDNITQHDQRSVLYNAFRAVSTFLESKRWIKLALFQSVRATFSRPKGREAL